MRIGLVLVWYRGLNLSLISMNLDLFGSPTLNPDGCVHVPRVPETDFIPNSTHLGQPAFTSPNGMAYLANGEPLFSLGEDVCVAGEANEHESPPLQ